MSPRAFRPEQIVITCEHASNRIPERYARLGLRARDLDSHITWDRGARQAARYLARHFGCPYYEGKYSRALIDLNRSPHNPGFIPKRSFGVPVPGNAGIDARERRLRTERYYEPFRTAVREAIERVIARNSVCLHLSVHSFVPRLGGKVRRADIGLLYDPCRAAERRFAARLVAALRERGFRVRRNYPYLGTADGHTTQARRIFPANAYLGIELELNQHLLDRPAGTRRLQRQVAAGIASCLARRRWLG